MKCRRENADVSGAKTQTRRSRLRVCVLQNTDANFLTRVTKTQTQTRLRRHMQRALHISVVQTYKSYTRQTSIEEHEIIMTDADKKQLDQSVHLSPAEMRMDPFSPREGKELAWKGVNMTLVSRAVHSSHAWCKILLLHFPFPRRMFICS